jgi:AraC family transcriptional regulator
VNARILNVRVLEGDGAPDAHRNKYQANQHECPYSDLAMSVTGKALWYIESHLDADVSLEAAADSVGVSRFHLSRAFTASTGKALTSYARARRLSVAATKLLNGAPDILAVALEAGYGSHEAFTRAFRQHFALTPEQFRTRGGEAASLLQEPMQMNPTTTVSTLATPRIVKGEAKLIFGLSKPCPAAGDPGIPGLWSRLAPYISSIANRIGNNAYGVIHNSDDAGSYDYICGVEVRAFPSEPGEFTRLRISPQTYAVFEHRDHVSAIAGTWRAIWEHGLADAGLKAADGPAFELYGERFNPMTGAGGFEIWVPVTSPAK